MGKSKRCVNTFARQCTLRKVGYKYIYQVTKKNKLEIWNINSISGLLMSMHSANAQAGAAGPFCSGIPPRTGYNPHLNQDAIMQCINPKLSVEDAVGYKMGFLEILKKIL